MAKDIKTFEGLEGVSGVPMIRLPRLPSPNWEATKPLCGIMQRVMRSGRSERRMNLLLPNVC